MNPAEERWTALVAWYRGAGRRLPWRGSPDPWVVLVSEVMLQQTQVARVATRIDPFLEEFPDPATMARSSRQQVLAAWSGLGYNRRAVRLHDAAGQIEQNGWPRTATELQSLPGVGRYTAAAVACLAFGEHVAAVDINVQRVLSRWVGRSLSQGKATAVANELLPVNEAHHWIQAIMDLGATTCTARAPACVRCPCEPWCADAEIAVSSRPQSRFSGSVREARGVIIRALSKTGRVDRRELAGSVDPDRLEQAEKDLAAEGLIAVADGVITLREPGVAPLDTDSPGQ